MLTGEEFIAKGVKPRNDFNPAKGTWGAFEVAARYATIDIDDEVFAKGFATKAGPTASAGGANVSTFGVNWYLNRFVRLAVNYEHAQFDDALSGQYDTENGVMTRVQLVF